MDMESVRAISVTTGSIIFLYFLFKGDSKKKNLISKVASESKVKPSISKINSENNLKSMKNITILVLVFLNLFLFNEIRNLSSELSSLNWEVYNESREVSKLKEILEVEEVSYRKKGRNIVADLEGQINDLEGQINDLEYKINNIKGDINDLEYYTHYH